MTMTISRAAMDALRTLACSFGVPLNFFRCKLMAELDRCTVVEPTAASAEAITWPTRLANHPAGDDSGDRIIGFRVSEGDPILGKYGLSEPLAWFRRVTIDRFQSATTPALREVTDGPMSDARALEIAQGAAAHMGNDYIDLLRALDYIRARLSTAQGVPDGWKLVPVEPTEEMLYALYSPIFERFETAYEKMLEVAPEAP